MTINGSKTKALAGALSDMSFTVENNNSFSRLTTVRIIFFVNSSHNKFYITTVAKCAVCSICIRYYFNLLPSCL